MRDNQAQFDKLTKTPVLPLIASLSVPTTISMLVTNIYNMVDTAFVGSLGTSQSGAVGIVFGFMSILQAFAFMFGQGSGSIMSRYLGKKDVNQANIVASTGFFGSLLSGAIIGVLSMCYLDRLIYLLGSTPTIAPYAKTYISYIIFAAPFMTASLTMNNILRYEGHARLGMVGLMIGAILNIAGDALFMFGMNMGIAGAGLSTMLTQMISFVILLSMFLRRKSQVSLSISNISFSFDVLGMVCATGFPSMLRQGLNSVATMMLNSRASLYGDAAVAAMSITSRIVFFVMAVSLGIGQGFQPVGSFNYGAGKYKRVREAFWVTMILSEVVIVLLAIPTAIFSESLIRLFRDDVDVSVIATQALRLQLCTVVCIPPAMICEMSFQATGQKLNAIFTSSLRSGILFIPVLILLSKYRGLRGVLEAQPLAYVLSLFVVFFFIRRFLSSLPMCDEA